MILRVHVPGASDYEIGDEIWQESIADAIAAEAEMIAGYAGADLLESPDPGHRDVLRDRLIHEMTAELVSVGDEYKAPDGVRYSLIEGPGNDATGTTGRLSIMSCSAAEPVVEEVLRVEELPLGSAGTRRAVVRWSDGTESAAVTFYADEVLFCEGDLVGLTHAQIRSLHFRRDRDWLES
jgi:hypothetical protein